MDLEFGLFSLLAFGSLGLIFLTDIFWRIKEFWRRWRLTDEERAEEDAWGFGGDFSLRNDSPLRGRHVSRVEPRGRGGKFNTSQRDPFDP